MAQLHPVGGGASAVLRGKYGTRVVLMREPVDLGENRSYGTGRGTQHRRTRRDVKAKAQARRQRVLFQPCTLLSTLLRSKQAELRMLRQPFEKTQRSHHRNSAHYRFLFREETRVRGWGNLSKSALATFRKHHRNSAHYRFHFREETRGG